MNAIVKVKGVVVEFADGPLVVPPLSLASVEALQDRLSGYGDGGIAQVSLVIDSLWHALKRNYPDLTRDQAADMVDMENMGEVMDAVMNVAGLKRKAGDSGEAKAAR